MAVKTDPGQQQQIPGEKQALALRFLHHDPCNFYFLGADWFLFLEGFMKLPI